MEITWLNECTAQNSYSRDNDVSKSYGLEVGLRLICQQHNFGNNRILKELRIMLE